MTSKNKRNKKSSEWFLQQFWYQTGVRGSWSIELYLVKVLTGNIDLLKTKESFRLGQLIINNHWQIKWGRLWSVIFCNWRKKIPSMAYIWKVTFQNALFTENRAFHKNACYIAVVSFWRPYTKLFLKLIS